METWKWKITRTMPKKMYYLSIFNNLLKLIIFHFIIFSKFWYFKNHKNSFKFKKFNCVFKNSICFNSFYIKFDEKSWSIENNLKAMNAYCLDYTLNDMARYSRYATGVLNNPPNLLVIIRNIYEVVSYYLMPFSRLKSRQVEGKTTEVWD